MLVKLGIQINNKLILNTFSPLDLNETVHKFTNIQADYNFLYKLLHNFYQCVMETNH